MEEGETKMEVEGIPERRAVMMDKVNGASASFDESKHWYCLSKGI